MQALNIAGYARISNDDDLQNESTTIETQKSLMQEYVNRNFPGAELTFYEDRDLSGYTFEKRPGYQHMRKNLGKFHKVMLINDLSRFARRNGRGLVELEDLRDMGIRIISISEGIDYPAKDDWLAIQIYFFVNEMPVTQTSKKVRNVIAHRQKLADWICSAPYGYHIVVESGKRVFQPDPITVPIIQMIYELYNQGWGYAKIAKHLTSMNIPTPTMLEKQRVESAGKLYKKGRVSNQWSHVSISGILQNDFYIGTFRTKKYTRTKINGKDAKLDESEHNVFEHHHEAVIDDKTFLLAQNERKARDKAGYRGVKKYDNYYSGLIFCGDCGAPMFAMSRKDLKPAYTCGTYHKHGRSGCTSHHTRMDVLDTAIKAYVRRLRDGSQSMLAELQKSIAQEETQFIDSATTIDKLEAAVRAAKDELKETQRAKIRAIAKKPEQEDIIEETYAEMEQELVDKIRGLQNQIELMGDAQNTLIRTNRVARTVLDVFDAILKKEKLSRKDVNILVQRITIYEDHIDIQLYPDIDQLLTATEMDAIANFKVGSMDIVPETIVQSALRRPDKVYTVNVIREGEPLEIYTERDGSVIFKKYSPMGEVGSLAEELAEAVTKTVGKSCAVCDRDAVIAVAGSPKREIHEKAISKAFEDMMNGREVYRATAENSLTVTEHDTFRVIAAVPIITEGDLTGCVALLSETDTDAADEVDVKVAQAAAQFLSRRVAV